MAKIPIRTNGFKQATSGPRRIGSPKKRFIKSRPLVQDARQKLIQKKRSNLVDARDVLAKMAKSQDARDKLNKLRQSRGLPTPNGNIKPIGAHILRKTDRNGKISLLTNKTKSGINIAIQKELGLIGMPQKKTFSRRPVQKVPQILRQPVEINYALEPIPRFESGLYKWSKPAASQLIGSLETRNRIAEGWHNFAANKLLRIPQGYVDLDAVDEDEDMPMVAPTKQTISLQGSSRISNIHSRLDSNPNQPETHGILGQPKTKVVVPAGHRIVVSNLQPSVTQDDVKELFEDIGQLLAARLVRPGVAEVIYINLKDAQKAVDTYHNRQLDGQPMKCLLVNKRPLNNPTAPPLTKMDQGILKTLDVQSASSSNKLVPDLSTIHKVLFQRK